MVQSALENVISTGGMTVILIAHRLSTIQSADKIVVLKKGRMVQVGTHAELMKDVDGHYSALVTARLDEEGVAGGGEKEAVKDAAKEAVKEEETEAVKETEEEENFQKMCWQLVKTDWFYMLIGVLGAAFAGAIFPLWGVMFAYMLDLLFTPVQFCDAQVTPAVCQNIWNSIADNMLDDSHAYAGWWSGIIGCSLVGYFMLGWGAGKASEALSKRIRDAGFVALVRQEVGYHDVHSVTCSAAQLSVDATLLKSFTSEPINTMVIALCSALLGVTISFVFMWPFALLSLGTLPAMAWASKMEMEMLFSR